MARHRGNPHWGKPAAIEPVSSSPTSFELIVQELDLAPDQYIDSDRLREWARSNKNSKYIPEVLLEAWGLEADSGY